MNSGNSTPIRRRFSGPVIYLACLLGAAGLLAPPGARADSIDTARTAIQGAVEVTENFPPDELRPTWREELLDGLSAMDGLIAAGDACSASDHLLGLLGSLDSWRDQVGVPVGAAHRNPRGITPQMHRLAVLDALAEELLRLRLALLGAALPGQACGGGATVAVDESVVPVVESLPPLAEDGPPRPMAAMRNARGIVTDFLENELWLLADTPAQAESAAGRLGAEIVATEVGDDGTLHALLRIEAPADHVADLPANLDTLRPGVTDAVAVSSPAGRNLLALAAAEAAAGVAIGINVMGLPDGIREGMTRDAHNGPAGWTWAFTPTGWSPNAFNWLHFGESFAQGIGVPEAWQLLELAGRMTPGSVPVGIVDQGFLDTDLHPAGVYRSTIAGFDGLGSESPIAGWHGLLSAQTAAGLVDNEAGAAGTGGPVALPVNVYSSYDFFLAMAGTRTALDNGAVVVSMSFSASIPSVFDWTAAPFRLFTGSLRDVTLVASAGNDGPGDDPDAGENQGNIDQLECFIECWEAYFVTPCENEGVICVGGLAHNSLNRSLGSSYGTDHRTWWGNHTVDVYAPYCGLVDGTGSPTLAEVYCGTSHASPYVAGIFALMHAAQPGIPEWILLNTIRVREDSPDPAVHRIIDALESVRAAMLPLINIVTPDSGASFTAGEPVTFEIFRHRAPPGPVAWSSDRDGSLGSGDVLTTDTLSVGAHTITANLGDLDSAIAISVGTIGILQPADGTSFIADQDLDTSDPYINVTLEGLAVDAGGTPITGSGLEWSARTDGGPPQVLGTGSPLTVRLHAVDGRTTNYEITLTATDASGHVQTFSIEVSVGLLF